MDGIIVSVVMMQDDLCLMGDKDKVVTIKVQSFLDRKRLDDIKGKCYEKIIKSTKPKKQKKKELNQLRDHLIAQSQTFTEQLSDYTIEQVLNALQKGTDSRIKEKVDLLCINTTLLTDVIDAWEKEI